MLFELKKPQPNGELIGRLMRRFIYTAGITGLMQVATLVIMTRVADAVTTAPAPQERSFPPIDSSRISPWCW